MNIRISGDEFTYAFFDLGIIDQFNEFGVDGAFTILWMYRQILQTFGIGLPIIKASNRSDRLSLNIPT